MNWWNSISTTEQILYIISAIASALLLLDLYFFVSKFKVNKSYKKKKVINYVLNPRSIYILLSVGSWSTIIAYKATHQYWLSLAIGASFGIIVIFAFAICAKNVLAMNNLPEVELSDLIGSEGVVYSTISPKGEGRGKVSVGVNGKMRVFDAIAYEDNKIIVGNNVEVIDAMGNDLLLVESIKEVL